MSLDMEILADQISRAFRGESWHGPSVLEVLAGVSAEDATAHPIAGAHSIWEIVLHGYTLAAGACPNARDAVSASVIAPALSMAALRVTTTRTGKCGSPCGQLCSTRSLTPDFSDGRVAQATSGPMRKPLFARTRPTIDPAARFCPEEPL